MQRTALISENPTQSGLMIDFLAKLNQCPDLTNLPSIDSVQLQENSAARPIRFGPGLLVFIDRLKKESYLANWMNSIEQE